MGIGQFFKVAILVQLLYAVAITMIAHSLPVDARVHINPFQEGSEDIDIQNTADKVSSSLEKQTDIPVIELGALVFYSGNILIDLILNFMTAIPQMFVILFDAFLRLIPIDTVISVNIKLFVTSGLTIFYVIGVINLLMNIRSGQAGIA